MTEKKFEMSEYQLEKHYCYPLCG